MSEQPMTRLVYASTATFDQDLSNPATQRELMQLARQSRANNPARGIGGVLHFGEGYFLQVLEGDPDSVESLFESIEGDERNREVQVLRRESTEEPLFAAWAMKYLTLENDIADFLKRRGMNKFNPYQLDDETLTALLELLATRDDSPEATKN